MDIRVVKTPGKVYPEFYPKGIIVSHNDEKYEYNYKKYVDNKKERIYETICHKILTQDYINECLRLSSFSVLAIDDKKILVAFSSVRYDGETFDIDILCSCVKNKGREILDTIIEIAEFNNIKKIQLNTFSTELVEYYKTFGFVVYRKVKNKSEIEKKFSITYYMSLNINTTSDTNNTNNTNNNTNNMTKGGKRKTRKRRGN